MDTLLPVTPSDRRRPSMRRPLAQLQAASNTPTPADQEARKVRRR